jgi:5-formaminoimidazole-4-carboxamide-1-(beta)-D-ribofuranosyl 5'-monophosphate synthetase
LQLEEENFLIKKEEIIDIVKNYEKDKITIGTLGSHSALNIFKGAKEEGFKTVCLCKKESEIVYRRFQLADEIIVIKDFSRLLDYQIQERLRELNTILVPHGSFNAYMDMQNILNDLYVPIFGNRKVLEWEIDREKQRAWLQKAGLTLPKKFNNPNEIDRLIIAKFPGARGGKGYFLADSSESFRSKFADMIRRGQLTKEDLNKTHLQEHVLGVNVYLQYFSSILKDEVELLGMDKRYESTIDGIGRVPANEQLQIDLSPTYTIVGNIPLVLRESLLPEVLRMGDNVAKIAKEIVPPGIIGPFCLETIITDKPEIITFEMSARIVAGSNVGIGTSPYAYLKYGKEMYMGRRIAREIKTGIDKNEIGKIVY